MQKLQDSVFSIIKTTNLSPAVFSFLQPDEDFVDKTPLGGILSDTKHGWLALGPKFCVVDLRTGLKVAARIFGSSMSNFNTYVTSVIELPTPLTENSQQLMISLQCEDVVGMIYILHVNGSQILRSIQTDVVVTQLAACDELPDGPFTCFDGVVMAGTKSGEIFVFDLNRASLIEALKDISQGYEHLIQAESNPSSLNFLPLKSVHQIEEQRDLSIENDVHLAVLLNENSLVDSQYIFRNPDGSVRMKAKRDHIRVTVLQYIPQLGSLAVGYNFGAFQIWNLTNLDLEFTSQVNVECLPVTHFGFQEPCDDPRAFCYLWVIFSVIDRFDEEEFPLAVMYSLTYQGKRMLSDTKCLYQEFSMATVRFQVELCGAGNDALVGGKCVSCHTYSVNSTLGAEGEDSMLNICQLVWECWSERALSSSQYGMLLFDLDQWYKDQMPATYRLESNAFMSATWCSELAQGTCVTLDVRLDPMSVAVYSHATRLEEHFYPNSLQYNCICLNTAESCVLSTMGIQRQIISSLDEVGPTALLSPTRLYLACVAAGLTPLYVDSYIRNPSLEEQRRFLLSVALEARLSRFLKRCALDWAPGTHSGAGCTLTFLVDWCWKRAIELKENAKELCAPLFSSATLPDRNVLRCLEHCVQQLTHLSGLLDSVITKCCNLLVPDALSEMEEKFKGIGTVSLYFQVVQWFLRVGLLPERHDGYTVLPYPAQQLYAVYNKRRLKLNRLQDNLSTEDSNNKSCSLLYIDQLIEQEFGGENIHQMWIKGGSECNGLYPPPSLYSLLRLYLLPDVPEEHKHSLVLYLLVDYSMIYDEVRYEAVIRRLMQFPTMFGLSNTAIKATQAFWHLDHRDFDFALDQLQCLTGNTLSEWQHNVVLSTLLAQKKTQAALQYLHVRKPPPIQNTTNKDGDANNSLNRLAEYDKLEEWQSCCNLYLARGLVYEALDVIRTCVHNACTTDDKCHLLNYFFKGCRNTGQLSKILQIALLPFEEEVFIKYLENCKEPQTSDILIMYYLQQARYLEAERYNNSLKHSRPKTKDLSTSVESLTDMLDREGARDTLIEVMCSSLPAIANTVARCALNEKDITHHVIAPKPMSVFVQAKSSKSTFIYKSSFIQDTIENASETWMNKPKMRKGIKRALNIIEDTPFICTPKLVRTKSVFSPTQATMEGTPPKRPKLDFSGTPKTPKVCSAFKMNEQLSRQMATLLDMPEAQSPESKPYLDRDGAETPHSILKIRRNDMEREAPSPVDSRYLGESDDEMLETASNHTHYSDSTKRQLRFTIPTASESGSTPSPSNDASANPLITEEDMYTLPRERETDISTDSFVTTASHPMTENHPLESPPKKVATEDSVKSRKSYKDTVRARRSLSISANSSLSDDPNASIESIADIPITLINPRYSGEKRVYREDSDADVYDRTTSDVDETKENVEIDVPKTPKGRRAIRSVGKEGTPLMNRSRSVTPERVNSPPVPVRITRSRSRTPELSPRSALAPIPEQPIQEVDSEMHPAKTLLSVPRQLRSRCRTPDRFDKGAGSPKLEAIVESPTKTSTASSSPSRSIRSRTPDRLEEDSANLEAIVESPTKTSTTDSSPSRRSLRSRTPDRTDKDALKLGVIVESPTKTSTSDSSSSPTRRSLRSRSRTPEVEIQEKPSPSVASPRSLRSRSKTPEKLMSPKKDPSKTKKSLSRLVLEANTFAKTKQVLNETESNVENLEKTDNVLECTPMKSKQTSNLLDVSLSPIMNKSVLQSPDESISISADKSKIDVSIQSIPAFTTIRETFYEKSVLCSYQSSVVELSQSTNEDVIKTDESINALKTLPAFTTINVTDIGKSVLHSAGSSIADTSHQMDIDQNEQAVKTDKMVSKPFTAFASMIETDFERSVLHSCESSVAGPSPDVSKENEDDHKNVSSLITNDSTDIEMKEDDETAAVKEKGKIVEIEREINEIECDMSEMESDGDDSSSDEEIVEQDNEPELNEAEDGESLEEEDDEDEESSLSSDEEIISIQDSDSDKSSNSDRLQIDEGTSESTNKERPVETIIQVQIEKNDEITKAVEQSNEASVDPLNQAQISILTDDNSVTQSDTSDLHLNYSDEKVPTQEKKTDNSTTAKSEKTKEPQEKDSLGIEKDISTKPNESLQEQVNIENVDEIDDARAKPNTQNENEKNKDTQYDDPKIKKQQDLKSKIIEEPQVTEASKQLRTSQEEENLQETQITDDNEVQKSSRKRTASTSSNKSNKDTEEPKTPVTRRRSQSTSNKAEEKTPEGEDITPSRRRTRTPTSTEVRKIITRRVSKEMSEKNPNSEPLLLDESVLSTPRRRTARSKSKQIDDNESVASESSVLSGRSRLSEESDDTKTQARKGRKSILVNKPELSVIPEITVEDMSKQDTTGDIIDYSDVRRLTRRQKAMLDTLFESKGSPSSSRRDSTTSLASTSAHSQDGGVSAPTKSLFDVQPIVRISLLDKDDFKGSADLDELRNDFSPSTELLDTSPLPKSRQSRAVSETKTTPKAAKIFRRKSVDVANMEGAELLVGRGRRASFTRACEALTTPKGRRASTELRREGAESPQSSPAARSRRASLASTLSTSDNSKRSKNTTAEETEE